MRSTTSKPAFAATCSQGHVALYREQLQAVEFESVHGPVRKQNDCPGCGTLDPEGTCDPVSDLPTPHTPIDVDPDRAELPPDLPR